MAENYKTDLEQAREALATLFRQREELAIKIAKQQQKVAALASLSDESEDVDHTMEMNLGGLTNACRTAFRAAGKRGLTPTELRSALEQLRFPTREYKNILSSLHTVMKRLETAGEIRRAIHDVHDGQDKSVYRWVGPNYGAPNSWANQMADAERDQAYSPRKNDR